MTDSPWITWEGGECPVPRGTLVDVRHRDGQEWFDQPAADGSNWSRQRWVGAAKDWRHDGVRGDIIAYRIANPEPQP